MRIDTPLRGLSAAVLCSLVAAAILVWRSEPTSPFRGDSVQFLTPAYNVLVHGTYSEQTSPDPHPTSGREPAYPLLLAALMALDRSFGSFTLDCLEDEDRCPSEIYRSAQAANGVLVALAGFALFLAAWALTGRPLAALTAGALIWLNGELADGRHDLMSDYLALLFLASAMAAAAWAAAWTAPCAERHTGPWRWVLAGALLALTALTKAIFLYFFLVAGIVALICLALLRDQRRSLAMGLAGLVLGFALVAGPWMARNAVVTGKFAIATDDRAGISLHVRNEYNRMTPTQFAAAFVTWTRGFGDNLAKQLFAPETLADFGHDTPGSFMHEGHLYGQMVRDRVADEGRGKAQVEAEIDARVRREILANLPAHAATTLPLFYRGLWIDEFIVFTFPALLWLTWTSLWRRRWAILMALSGGWFSLGLYPLVSLNIDRYQITAVPALALAGGVAATALYDAFKARRLRRSLAGPSRPAGPSSWRRSPRHRR